MRRLHQAAAAAGAGGLASRQLALRVAAPGRSSDGSIDVAALLGVAPGSSSAAAAASAAGGGLLQPLAVPCLGVGLPPELQQLFVTTAAGAEPPRRRGAAAVAPVAALHEIGRLADDEDGVEEQGLLLGIGGGGGVTRCSLSLSLASTPGSAAAAAGAAAAAPGSEQTPAAAGGGAASYAAAVGTAGASIVGPGPSTAGFSVGHAGYTPGSLGGLGGPDSEPQAGVLRPLDPAGLAAAANAAAAHTQDDEEGDGFVATLEGRFADVPGDDAVMMTHADDEDVDGGGDKENPPSQRGHGGKGGAALFHSSLHSTQEALEPWPADAERLAEQDEGASGGRLCAVVVHACMRDACDSLCCCMPAAHAQHGCCCLQRSPRQQTAASPAGRGW